MVIQVDCKAVIRAALDRAAISSASFVACASENHLMCVFSTGNVAESEEALDQLHDVGVGKEMGIISVSSLAFRNSPGESEMKKPITSKQPSRFAKSVKSRMAVQQIIDRVMASATMTFDYVAMLNVASLIAMGGLATGNSVIIVASMLVSPIMGPVLALTFGVTLKKWDMAKKGLKNEIISIIVCIINGFVFGLCYALISSNTNDWPTDKMLSRSQPEGLADGAFIAAVSGVGVALSVLGDYLSTVIGVAISASLLPPAVNSGMLFAFALYLEMYPENKGSQSKHYNKREYFVMSAWSLALTIENIIIIFGVALIMFKIKEVVVVQDKNAPIWKSVTNFKKKMKRQETSPHQLLFHKVVTDMHWDRMSVCQVSTQSSPLLKSSMKRNHMIPIVETDSVRTDYSNRRSGSNVARQKTRRVDEIFEEMEEFPSERNSLIERSD